MSTADEVRIRANDPAQQAVADAMTRALATSMKQTIEDMHTTAFGPWLDNWYASAPFETEEELHRRAREGE